ncbi:MAG: NADH-quinone oxidoreductase subunit D [Candidatus Brocadiales bacterium]
MDIEEKSLDTSDTDEFMINMGPQHPGTHGVLRLILKLDGEEILSCVPDIGFLHRGMEKIAENRTYLQFIPFTDRIDYLSAMSSNMAYVLAVERLANIPVPRRAEFLRIIMLELNRIASHLIWLGTYGLDLGAFTPFLYAFREREKILDLFEMTCGARLTYCYFRFGGVSQDIPPEFMPALKNFLPDLKEKLDEYDVLLTNNIIFLGRTKNVGILSKDMAIDYGVTGPNLRGSGVKWDLRKDDPYSIYSEFEFDVPTCDTGDSWGRYNVRIEEMRQSIRIIEQAIEKLPQGNVNSGLMPNLKIEPGEIYARTESPRGELGVYLVSDGTKKPYRLKIRSPSFSNLSVLPEIVKGWKVADVIAILGSIDIVMGDVDR